MKQQESINKEDIFSRKLSLSQVLSCGIIVILCIFWEVSYSALAHTLLQEDQTLSETSTLPKLRESWSKEQEPQPTLLNLPPELILIPETETPLSVSKEYTLGPGDHVQIDVFNIPEYSGQNGQHQVQIDGTLNLPLIGKVYVQGRTLEKAKGLIEEKYGEYLQIPIVNLNLLAARPLRIAIAGEVQYPGSYTISPIVSLGGSSKSGTQMPTVTKALQVAGGVTTSADIRQIKIRRFQLNAPEELININLWELLQSGNLVQDIFLLDGDTLFVPSIAEINPVELTQLASANFAGTNNKPLKIAVVGEVARPGPYILETDIDQSQVLPTAEKSDSSEADSNISLRQNTRLHTVTKAIKMAGGITLSADIKEIKVRRLTRAGEKQIIKVNLWELLQSGDLSQDIVLQTGDTIYVPVANEVDLDELAEVTTSSFSLGQLKINVIGEVVKPGTILIDPNSTLNQALLAAGGFNPSRAETKEIELIRLNPNGTVTRRKVQVDFSAKANEETNPALLHNDVIVVGRSSRAAFSDNIGGVLAPFNPINRILGIFFDIFD
ncbi:polysaccharide export protein [Trichodesmium erythraeum IMS101]|uniref:Polysaccharide export protein n=1 Tax=Trichodesmium erythraeum (strain IMS101) TaxID=203124 RepID=Q113Z5_TRIEI|nr:SLBB domain-containing protein [Trichodesmium erythraeum GBRTRLIN201]